MTVRSISNLQPTELQVAICTHGHQGFMDVAAMTLPQMPRVKWLVECQTPDGSPYALPESLVRNDIDVRFSSTRGIAANRNLALRDASAPYLWMADDDLIFTEEGLRQVIATMDANPGISLFCFRHNGTVQRRYPQAEKELRSFALRRHYPYAFEMSLRMDDVRAKGLSYNELTGKGAPCLCAGEEDLFTYYLLRSGLRGRFFPFTVVTHHDPTTIDYNHSDAMWRTRGAVLSVLHPLTWPLRVIKHPDHLKLMLEGVRYAWRNKL